MIKNNFESDSKGWRGAEAPSKAVTVGLPKQPKGGNFKAMPYDQVPSFIENLRSKTPTRGRQALLFQILTGARPGEVRYAKWGEIDFDKRNWNRPSESMKLGEAHTATLSEQAISLLLKWKGKGSPAPESLIFGNRHGKPLSDMTFNKLLRDAGLQYDAHGFRSSFRDWAAEQMPEIPDPVAEAALAHTVRDQVVRAYKRTTFIEMRRKLLESWGKFIFGGVNHTQA